MLSAEEDGECREQNSVLACLECLRELHPDLGLIDVCILMLVAERPGISVSEIESRLGVVKLTVSRALRAFAGAEFQNALPPALGLIELRRSSPNGRSLTAWLTGRGQQFVRELNAHIERGVQI